MCVYCVHACVCVCIVHMCVSVCARVLSTLDKVNREDLSGSFEKSSE